MFSSELNDHSNHWIQYESLSSDRLPTGLLIRFTLESSLSMHLFLSSSLKFCSLSMTKAIIRLQLCELKWINNDADRPVLCENE